MRIFQLVQLQAHVHIALYVLFVNVLIILFQYSS